MLFSRTDGSLQVHDQTGPPLHGVLRPDWVKCAGIPQNAKYHAIICTSVPALIDLLITWSVVLIIVSAWLYVIQTSWLLLWISRQKSEFRSSSAPVFRSGGRAGGIGSAKRLRWRSFITGASWLHTSCTLSSAGLPAWACPVRTLCEASSPTFSLFISLSHSQLVLSRGIHPSLLPPIFFPAVPAALSTSLSAPSFLTPPSSSSSSSSSYLNLLSSVISILFICPGETSRAERESVCVCVCVFVCVYTQRMAQSSGAGGKQLWEPVKQAAGPVNVPRRQSTLLG